MAPLTTVTSGGILDGTIVNADVNASAAIAGTKIAPDFGSQNVDTTGNILLDSDSNKLKIGDDEDLQIYHNGGNGQSYIDHTGTLNIRSTGNIEILKNGGDEPMAKFAPDGAVSLYYDNAIKINTNAAGVTVSGNVDISDGHLEVRDSYRIKVGGGPDLQLYHDGSDSYITNATNDLKIINTSDDIEITAADNLGLYVQGGESAVVAIGDGAVELYYNNGKTLETTANGITVFDDGKDDEARLIIQGGEGNAATLYLYADDGDDNQDKWRQLATTGGEMHFQSYTSGSWEDCLHLIGNGAVELYYDNVRKFKTDSTGVEVTGAMVIPDGNAGSNRISIGDAGDLLIFHNGNDNILDCQSADLWIQNHTLGGNESMAAFKQNGAVELYYDGTKKFQTEGGNNAARIYGNTIIRSAANNMDIATFTDDGTTRSCNLYYNGAKKFELHAHGFKHHGDNTDIQMMVGASDQDDVYIKDGSIGFDSAYNGTNTGWISVYGYNGGVTQFRTTKIGDGKGTTILDCVGSTGVVSGDLNDTSDERLKKEIVSIGSEGLTKIKQLRPVSFKWRNTDRNSYGFIAQEVETILPHAVATSETDDNSWTKLQDAATETGAVVVRDPKSINTNSIVAYLTKAVQELSTEVETLKTKVAALEG